MPYGLINDPNGLSYYQGTFHIFFQWNPYGCEHKTKHWGLVKTKDFLHFTAPEIVLKPEDWFDKDGCYSGGAMEKDGVLHLFYTGNVKDSDGKRTSHQCLAEYRGRGSARKKGVVIDGQPEGYTAHFRDPVVITGQDGYHMVVGAQTEALEGCALLYHSEDMESWQMVGKIGTGLGRFGYMWECPNLFSAGEGKTGLLFSPQGLVSEEFRYQNLYQSGYIIGDWNRQTASFSSHSEFKELDMGFDFYAPQVFCQNGQTVLMGWAGMPDLDAEYPTADYGWIFGLTLPRVLEWREGILYQRPLEQLENLRGECLTDLTDAKLTSYRGETYRLLLDSRTAEVQLELSTEGTDACPEIVFQFGEEFISIRYDKYNAVCVLDRSNMRLGGKGVRRFRLKTGECLKLQIFIDRSLMEIFYQDGQETTTCAYFPQEAGMELVVRGTSAIKKVQVWDLKRIQYEASDDSPANPNG